MVSKNVKSYSQGEMIIEEGHTGSTAYLIRDGMVEVLKRQDDRDVVLTVLGPGEFFGEMSLLDPELERRSATVRALEDTQVEIMNKEEFEEYLGQISPGVRALLVKLADRLRRTTIKVEAKVSAGEEPAEGKSLDLMITPDELEKAREQVEDLYYMERKCSKGQVIMQEGEHGQCCFIINKGRVEISRTVKGRKVVINELGEGDILGESALFEDARRIATVTALTDCELMVFGKRDMVNMARKSPLELFVVLNSMSDKLDRTNGAYGNALIELDHLRTILAELVGKVEKLGGLVKDAGEESERLKELISKGLNA